VSKIILLGPAYPLRGGIANFNEALCSTLVRMGHGCSIVSFTLQYPGFLFPGTTQLAAGDPPPEGVQVLSMLNSVNPLTWYKTAKHIAAQKPDLLIIRYWLPFMAPCLGFTARRVKKLLPGVTIKAICDNVVPHEHRPGDRMLTKYFTGACDSFVVMSKSVMDDLRTFTSKPAVMKFHPVYDIFGQPVPKAEARKQLGLEPEGRYVLFFGFIRKYKGLDLLLEAMAALKQPDVKLLVAGEFYEDAKPYQELIDKLGIRDRLVLKTEYIPKEDVRYWFSAADLVAQPYRDATQSGVTQIAYHFEKPMVVTDVGGLPEIVPDGKAGYVVAPEPGSIAKAIAGFYENNAGEKLLPGVKEMKKRFSWEEFAEGIVKSDK
jgi:glycosyltransferase involved in cell wall biosynthesis